jgi:hypothetical protein
LSANNENSEENQKKANIAVLREKVQEKILKQKLAGHVT